MILLGVFTICTSPQCAGKLAMGTSLAGGWDFTTSATQATPDRHSCRGRRNRRSSVLLHNLIICLPTLNVYIYIILYYFFNIYLSYNINIYYTDITMYVYVTFICSRLSGHGHVSACTVSTPRPWDVLMSLR